MENSIKSDIKKRAYKFVLEVIRMVDQLPTQGTSGILYKQLIRSATSIGANIIEAQAASSKKDFKNFLSYALKSANETNYWLALLRDTDKIEASRINPIIQEAKEISNILGASIVTLKKSL
jgi:four helix bundle protein